MQDLSRYLEYSLKGQWVKLAQEWLGDNGPCSKAEYLERVIPLMPTHIMLRGRRCSQRQLALRSLRNGRIRVEGDLVFLDKSNQKEISKSSRSVETIDPVRGLFPYHCGSTDRIRNLIRDQGFVTISDLKHIANAGKLLKQIVAQGEIEREGDRYFFSNKSKKQIEKENDAKESQ